MRKSNNRFFAFPKRFSSHVKIHKPVRYTDADAPLRGELFSAEQLEQHAADLAKKHHVTKECGGDSLLGRLSENERVLQDAYRIITKAAAQDKELSPADKWFLDNFYLIKEQILAVRQHLPKGYSRKLPRLTNGPMAGYPRVYEIIFELVSHVDGRTDMKCFISFVTGYQSVTPLTMGELWAIPIMLRLALIENLRRIMARIILCRYDWDSAREWVDRLVETAEREPGDIILLMAEFTRTKKLMRTPFVAEFARRLQGQGQVFSFIISWIEQRLGEKGLSIEQVVQDENRQQAADQVSIENSINSMRFVDEMDWHVFIENVSVVEQVLREDVSGTYARMDFASRDRYRHVVEDIAGHSGTDEIEIAKMAVRMTMESEEAGGQKKRTSHVGYYLVDKGLPDLERAAGVRRSLFWKLKKYFSGEYRYRPVIFYIGAIFLLTAAGTAMLLLPVWRYGIGVHVFVAMCVFTFIALSQLAVELVNRLVTLMARPGYLPRMDFSQGIPSNARTLVIVPALLGSLRDIENLLGQMEIRYMGNRDSNLHFALLTDFCDAPVESMPDDSILLEAASKGVEALNEKYGGERSDIFFLFHRPRLFNPQEKVWMGYERKRGKLSDINSFLRGNGDEKFSSIVGDTRMLRKVKYAITLDTDTQLPNGSARELVSIAEHPLNRPQYDENRHLISEGYGILQPRVGVSLLSANRSRFAQIFSGDPRFDPYTRAISDVYQDLFGEGSFIGKGLYDVDVFISVLEERFPENRILSHDLLEGCYARTALVSDVLICEDFPSTYSTDVSRRHRWIRGDWQIAAWIFPYAPGPGGFRLKNPISALSRWKIFDNLRRSLVPPALFLMLVSGWIWMKPAWLWTAVGAVVVLGPSVLFAAADIVRKARGLTVRFRLRETVSSAGRSIVQLVFTLIFLPYEAYVCMDAILRTAGRLLFTNRGLLQWTAAKSAERAASLNHVSFWKRMLIAPFTAIFLILYFTRTASGMNFTLLFLPIFWLLCPYIAWLISLPKTRREKFLSSRNEEFLRKIARKTWLFFETFVGDESNWLPIDNYQEQPVAKPAHRTSPTNIGFALASNLSAYDFGYISVAELLGRTGKTLNAMERMERFHGHFYNWYDTRTLKPLPPLYVSTVDSGNLQYFLEILRQGLLDLPEMDIIPERLFDGLADTLKMFVDEAGKIFPVNSPVSSSVRNAIERLLKLADETGKEPRMPGRIKEGISNMQSALQNTVSIMNLDEGSDALLWANAAEKLCADIIMEIESLSPCAEMLPLRHVAAGGHGEEIPDELKVLLERLENIQTLNDVVRTGSAVMSFTDRMESFGDKSEFFETMLQDLRKKLTGAVSRAQERIELINVLAMQCGSLLEMEYDFLYNKSRNLLAIGFNVEEHRRDASHYDLLASEARLGSFLLISRGILPLKHWFSLGRLVTSFNGEPVLLSWSGSLFEYLMPLLVMPDYENTFLNQTYRTVVDWQIKHGMNHRIPWGFSESGYNSIDAEKNYLYAAFGVPGLGFKRGLAENLVVAPYASALALMVKPETACNNLQRLAREGSEGKYGLYEAVDYTRGRVARGKSKAVVHSFMAHHQGMILLSASYVLLSRPMQERFEKNPAFKAAELLLQEKVPDVKPFFPSLSDSSSIRREEGEDTALMRVFNTPDTPFPEVHLLSNGRYCVMVTNSGGGYSRWNNVAVTRWREDATCDNMGIFCYIRDMDTEEFWSAGFQPARKYSKSYEAIFSQARAEFRRYDNQLRMHTEIAVSPEEDVELRRVHITNFSRKRRTIEITSYAEVVLAAIGDEATHPVFNGLFLETKILKERQTILCRRRPRSDKEEPIWLAHLMRVHNADTENISYETDRALFIGRGRTLRNPQAVDSRESLSDSEGSVLDPVVAIKARVVIEAEETAVVDMVFGITQTYEEAAVLAGKYHDKSFADRVFALSWTHSQVILHQLGITESDAQLFGRLAGALIYANSYRRSNPGLLAGNRRSQSALWGYGISGDLPVLLMRIGDESRFEIVKDLVDAHAYWRIKGLPVDFIIWNEDQSGYRQLLQDRIMSLITADTRKPLIDAPGGIFVRRSDQIADEDKVLMQTAARVIMNDTGSIAEQMEFRRYPELNIPDLKPAAISEEPPEMEKPADRNLIFNNGTGGFTHDGREYIITTTRSRKTPVPWVNVLANPSFGTVVSESGTAYTWSENAHEFRITPWYNDPVTDRGGEAFFIRDEETGMFWSATPLPAGGKNPYVSRHGFGYSVFEYEEQGISSEMWTYVAIDRPVKFVSIKVRNKSGRKRKISLTGYIEPVMGQSREKSQMHVVSGIDPESRALFAKNPFGIDFPGRIVFFEVNVAERSVTG
ncbi:MAG TPA: glucoamylase family protein, partial [bacterium]|nr:glucoamylase family protein [bacterium]